MNSLIPENIDERMKAWIVAVSVGAALVANLSACSGAGRVLAPWEGDAVAKRGYVHIETDAEGMRALADWQTGVAVAAKADGNIKNGHHQLRELQTQHETLREVEKTKRETAPGLIGRMFGQ